MESVILILLQGKLFDAVLFLLKGYTFTPFPPYQV